MHIWFVSIENVELFIDYHAIVQPELNGVLLDAK